MPNRPAATALAVFVGGGLGGALLDQLHVRSGALSYPHPVLAGQPLWVAPQFGVGAVVVLAAMAVAARFTAAPPPRRADLAVAALWFVAAYAASAVLWRHHAGLLLGGYAVTVAARFALGGGVWRGLPAARPVVAAAAVVLAAGGCVYEGSLTRTGAFAYATPQVYGVPIWLAGIYLHGAPLGLATAMALRKAHAA